MPVKEEPRQHLATAYGFDHVSSSTLGIVKPSCG